MTTSKHRRKRKRSQINAQWAITEKSRIIREKQEDSLPHFSTPNEWTEHVEVSLSQNLSLLNKSMRTPMMP